MFWAKHVKFLEENLFEAAQKLETEVDIQLPEGHKH